MASSSWEGLSLSLSLNFGGGHATLDLFPKKASLIKQWSSLQFILTQLLPYHRIQFCIINDNYWFSPGGHILLTWHPCLVLHNSRIYLFGNLNIFKFLCSIFVLDSVVTPALWWILPDQCSQLVSHKLCDLGGTLKFYSFLRLALIQLFYVSIKYTLFKVYIHHVNSSLMPLFLPCSPSTFLFSFITFMDFQ